MKKVLVLFGGVSSEHDVSCVSASYVVSNIPRDKYEVCPLGITKEGEWFLFEGDVSLLPEDKWIKSGKCTKALLSPDRKDHGITVFRESGPEKIHIDVCFPVMHGKTVRTAQYKGFWSCRVYRMSAAAFLRRLCAWIRRSQTRLPTKPE